MSGTIDISIPECQAYLGYADGFGKTVASLMGDLQTAITRAVNVWHDDSALKAQAEAAQCTANLSSAFEQLQPVLDKLRQQIDWAVAGASM